MSVTQIRLAKSVIDPIAWKIRAEAIIKKHFTSERLEEIRLGRIEANSRLASFGFEKSPLDIWCMNDVFYIGRIIDRDFRDCNLNEVMEITQIWHDKRATTTRLASLIAAMTPAPVTAQAPTTQPSCGLPVPPSPVLIAIPPRCRNEARDAWVAKQRARKTPLSWAEIFDDGVRLAARRGWDMPGSPDSLSEAYRKRLNRQRRNHPKS